MTDARLELTDEQWGGAEVGDYIALLKPRVMSLVIFTALVGMMVAPGGLHPVLAVVSLLCISVGAGASGALNMWYDADIDAVMKRTAGRPIPSGRILPSEALTFGLILSVFSVLVLGVAVNWLAAGLLAFTIFFYAVVYTVWLKRWTAQNIVIGGAAGALPPVVGWACVTGGLSYEPLVLFAIIFTWTPPHFWALALFASKDYAKAGIPMMPNVAGDASTRRQILAYSVLLAGVGLLPWVLGFGGLAYGVIAALLGAEFIRRAVVLLRQGDADNYRAAKKLFGFSIVYLFTLFAVLLVQAGLSAVLGA
ncbi:protoheme IX farnesyltransferase [Faunimonas pinastri]|uniref:Protoheme IX farnesyltransferase n=1 Tax=Faunimonas pinastri TaxID=1855383 RepID=A0A1H8ZPZ5_9HYPH|nr:heme o synthase [Faunimonas pinastri]SEP65738.1 protoheme IX farnesyltransferase [Faunimonas pinastri]